MAFCSLKLWALPWSPAASLRGNFLPHRSSRYHEAQNLVIPKSNGGSSVDRRPIFFAATGALVVLTAGFAFGKGLRSAAEFKMRGTNLFLEGDVKGSLDCFDKVLNDYPDQLPQLWQRGICLYYVNRFEDGAAQFRANIQSHPNDVEELIWCFLCEARVYGIEESRKKIPPMGRDGRPYMKSIYELFKNGGEPQQLLLASDDDQEHFYKRLYAGLHYEAEENEEAARAAIVSASKSPYSSRSSDYMVYVCKVHCKVRNWSESA